MRGQWGHHAPMAPTAHKAFTGQRAHCFGGGQPVCVSGCAQPFALWWSARVLWLMRCCGSKPLGEGCAPGGRGFVVVCRTIQQTGVNLGDFLAAKTGYQKQFTTRHSNEVASYRNGSLFYILVYTTFGSSDLTSRWFPCTCARSHDPPHTSRSYTQASRC